MKAHDEAMPLPETMKRTIISLPALAIALALGACGGGEPERQPLNEAVAAQEKAAAQAPPAGEAPRLPPEVQMHIDSGNIAYRAKDYRAALRHYQEAARRGPDEAAPWFGVSMAATALGDRATADSAQARVRALSPGMQVDPHPGGTDGAASETPPASGTGER